jgi:large subunit ribosomal protein L25
MPENITLSAELRALAGKGPARATRRAGRIPGIVYGGGREPMPISLEPRELSRALARRGFFATLIDLQVNGSVERALPREVQYHPVTDKPLHVDFMRVAATSRVKVTVHGIELNCPVDGIPDHIIVSLEGLDIGDSVHISAVAIPEGCRPTITGRDFTIASIAASSAVREEATTTVPTDQGAAA